jgi:hypothetical protein
VERAAFVAQHAAQHEVERLHSAGALVDRQNAGIAQVLLGGPFAGVARAAQNLNGLAGAEAGGFRAEILGDRQQPREHEPGLRARGLVGFARLQVGLGRGGQRERAGHFGAGGAGQQQALDVAMPVDGYGRGIAAPALAALGRIGPGKACRSPGDPGALAADRQAHAHDHREKLGQSASGRADQGAARASKPSAHVGEP